MAPLWQDFYFCIWWCAYWGILYHALDGFFNLWGHLNVCLGYYFIFWSTSMCALYEFILWEHWNVPLGITYHALYEFILWEHWNVPIGAYFIMPWMDSSIFGRTVYASWAIFTCPLYEFIHWAPQCVLLDDSSFFGEHPQVLWVDISFGALKCASWHYLPCPCMIITFGAPQCVLGLLFHF